MKPNEAQSTLLLGEEANDVGAVLDLLIESLKHVGAFEMLVMLPRQPIEGQSFFNVLFHPRAEARILLLPAQQPGGEVSAGFLGVAPIVEPARSSMRQSSATLRGR